MSAAACAAGSVAVVMVSLHLYGGWNQDVEGGVRYYFDIRDGAGVTVDNMGMTFPDEAAAIAEARKSLAIWASDLAQRMDRTHVTVAVRSDAGEIARLTLKLQMVVSPARSS